jgi:DNA repair protein RecO (recombination protein O)
MDWRDKGIVLETRRLGETGVIATLFTQLHGRHLGLVRGGTSRRMKPLLQPGNTLEAAWRGRLEDHLGTFTLEPMTLRAGLSFGDPLALSGLTSACALAAAILPEREAHPRLYEAFEVLLDTLETREVWPAVYVRFELALLQDLGFGLDLTRCAVTGGSDSLTHVSPRSGRAVSAEAAAPYAPKLLALPRFLVEGGGEGATWRDVADGLKLTGTFLERRVLTPQDKTLPDARARLLAKVDRLAAADGA